MKIRTARIDSNFSNPFNMIQHALGPNCVGLLACRCKSSFQVGHLPANCQSYRQLKLIDAACKMCNVSKVGEGR